jgi:hypothetical protein
MQMLQGVVPDGVTVHMDDSVGADATLGKIGAL